MLNRVQEFLPRLREANRSLLAGNKERPSIVDIEPLTSDDDEDGAGLDVAIRDPHDAAVLSAGQEIRAEMEVCLGVLDIHPSSSLSNASKNVLESQGITLIDRELKDEADGCKPQDPIERALGLSPDRSDSTRKSSLIQELR